VSFVQLLSRHGSRYPTASRSKSYNETIASIHHRTRSYSDEYSFLQLYTYSLGADDITKFGEMEMFYSGVTFYNRYHDLAQKATPFVRASGDGRVLASAQFFSSGYHTTKTNHSIPDTYPYDILVIGEYPDSNNTLNHGLCTAFETAPPPIEQYLWALKVVPPIMARVNHNLPGADLSAIDILNLMDLCPFETVASADGIVPPFCDIFTYEEWREYEYFQDLGKYYGYGQGSPLGPTQGVGFVNELIARMTNSSVRDRTCVNHTLDSSPSTFPLGLPLYADFSHDNDMTSVFFALGLYDSLPKYVNDPGEARQAREGYSASTTVPFGARAYVEKMVCVHSQEELVRIIVNDRVVMLRNCEADALGRCKLGAFVKSLGFARNGGEWGECFDV
jgi:Histidine phosphatase superfamily (branch 2)